MAKELNRTRRTDAEKIARYEERVREIKLRPLRAAARKALAALDPLIEEARAAGADELANGAIGLKVPLYALLPEDESTEPAERSLES